jgi:hypothetical protein
MLQFSDSSLAYQASLRDFMEAPIYPKATVYPESLATMGNCSSSK